MAQVRTVRSIDASPKFRETRQMGKRQATTTLEVTEYEPPSHVRIVSDEGGTVWDTVFTITPCTDPAGPSGGSTLEMVMDIRPYRFAGRLVAPIATKMVTKAIEKDMDSVKAHCESST